jgi:hypothetical protein
MQYRREKKYGTSDNDRQRNEEYRGNVRMAVERVVVI